MTEGAGEPADDPEVRLRTQLERARGSWELLVRERPERADPRFALLRRALRAKSFEADALHARLPGPVRRGARLDLEPLRARLEQLGFAVALEPRPEPGSAPAVPDSQA